MDRKKLEEETYKALKQYFESNQDEEVVDGKLLCEISPGTLSYVLESLVTPVITAILADYLIRKWQSVGKKECHRVERIKRRSNKEGKLIKKLGIKKEKAEEVCDKVSTTVTVELEAASEEELREVISLLRKISDK